jgi:predicted acylesterase/phospholipase RssA
MVEKRNDKGRWGVVLSTGDLRGIFAHAGFLLALEELEIFYKAMAGSSAGALVSSIVASGRNPKEAAEWLQDLRVKDYWQKDSIITILYRLLIRAGRGYTGIVSTDRLERIVSDLLKVKNFEDCPIPLYIVATNITKGIKEVFHTGEIAPYAVASAAIPVLFKAKRIGDSYYIDGGVFDLSPRSAICCRENLDVLIVNQIEKSQDRLHWNNSFMSKKWSLMHLVGRMIEAIYENERFGGEEGISRCPGGCGARILTLKPKIDSLDRLKPQEGKKLLQQGYEETLRLLPSMIEKLTKQAPERFPIAKFHCN